MLKPRFLMISGLILLAIASRLLPHPPNFAPITAIALFGGAYYSSKHWAFIAPMLIMFASDLFLGFHSNLLAVYGSFALIVWIGFTMRDKVSVGRIIGTSLAGSVLFFLITNLSVWLTGTMYPMTTGGLFACYIAGLPFFQYSVLGTLAYAGVLFGSFEIARRRIPALAPALQRS